MVLKIIKFLGNRKAGFILTLISVISLIAGSIVMNFNPDIYPRFFRFDLNYFFNPADPLHAWLYILLIVFSLLGGSMFFSTIETILNLLESRKDDNGRNIKEAGLNRRRKLSAVFAHFATILALAAHLYDGFSGEAKQIRINSLNAINEEVTKIHGIGLMKIESMKSIKHPDGSAKDTIVFADFLLPDGSRHKKEISFNSPAMFNPWTKELLIQDGRTMPYTIVIEDVKDKKKLYVSMGRPLSMESGSLQFLGSFEARNGINVANFSLKLKTGETKKLFMVIGNTDSMHSAINIAGKTYTYSSIINANLFTGYYIYNPSIPIVISAVFFMILGLVYLRKNNTG